MRVFFNSLLSSQYDISFPPLLSAAFHIFHILGMEGNVSTLIGKELGKYRITERIGRGGMAEVYLGMHTLLDRPVAIKVLHGYLTEDISFIERFKREAKSVANLRHPNIVQVYDFDVYEDMLFMVMEYIDGTNLHERLVALDNEGKRLPIKQVGSIINDVASALDYAHSQGMLHRDVKPSNILIDKRGKAYLTDFGIARILSDHKLTATGTMLGTPAYMSPEQGRGDELTEESDIYSLGIVAFEMLTGQVPYDAKTPIGIVNKQITEPVPAISSLVDGVPATAQEVIDRALAKSPGSRYSSAEELVIALKIALHALEASEVEKQEAAPDAAAVERAAAPTVAPSAKVGAGEDTLSAATVAMTEPDLDKATVAMLEDKADQATIAMEEPALEKATVTMQSEEISPSEKSTEAGKKVAVPAPAGKKMPFWAWIAIGAVVLGGAAFAVTQFLPGRETAETPAAEVAAAEKPTPRPQPEEPEPEQGEEAAFFQEPGVVVFDGENRNGGLRLRQNGDADVEMVTAGKNQEMAWRTGNNHVMPAEDGNEMEDSYIKFDIDDNFLYEVPLDHQVQIEVEYLDDGTDAFHLQYDGDGGGPYGDGNYKEDAVIHKTDSGEFKTAVFVLFDPSLGNRIDGDSDFRLYDQQDGAETIRRVIVRVPSAEQSFTIGDQARDTGDFERAILFYQHAMDAGFGDRAWGHRMLGEMYAQTGRFGECIDNFNALFEQVGEDIDAFLWRGDCFSAVGDVANARMDYEHFLALTENNPDYVEQRGHVQIWMDENR